MLPTAAAGLSDWWREHMLDPRHRVRPALAAVLVVALLWADPDLGLRRRSWFTKPYQLHWPALRSRREIGSRPTPTTVPPDARIMAWFPWEFRLASGQDDRPHARGTSAPTRDRGPWHRAVWGDARPLGLVRDRRPNVDPETFGPYLNRPPDRRRPGSTRKNSTDRPATSPSASGSIGYRGKARHDRHRRASTRADARDGRSPG